MFYCGLDLVRVTGGQSLVGALLQHPFLLETIDAGCDAAAASRHDRASAMAMLTPKIGGSILGAVIVIGCLVGVNCASQGTTRRREK